jgi:hypothetical protein
MRDKRLRKVPPWPLYAHLLESHPGIIESLKASENGIELPLFKRVNLHNYIQREENRPLPSLAAKWIGDIADILCHFHERRVFFGRHRHQTHPHL